VDGAEALDVVVGENLNVGVGYLVVRQRVRWYLVVRRRVR
jgi:hypothetical protein